MVVAYLRPASLSGQRSSDRSPDRTIEAKGGRDGQEIGRNQTHLLDFSVGALQASLDLANECEPDRRGYYARLEDLWNAQNPTIPSRGPALEQKLRALKKQGRLPTLTERCQRWLMSESPVHGGEERPVKPMDQEVQRETDDTLTAREKILEVTKT